MKADLVIIDNKDELVRSKFMGLDLYAKGLMGYTCVFSC